MKTSFLSPSLEEFETDLPVEQVIDLIDETDERDALVPVFQDQVAISNDISGLSQIAEAVASSPNGVEPAVGNAVEVAVEAISGRNGLSHTLYQYREYATKRTKFNNTQVSLEGIVDTIKKLIDKLLEYIRRGIEFLRKMFTFRKAKAAAIEAKTDNLEKKVKEAKTAQATAAPTRPSVVPENDEYLYNVRTLRPLTVKGTIPEGLTFIQHLHSHAEQMSKLTPILAKSSKDLVELVIKSAKLINSKGGVFQGPTTDAYNLASATPFDMPISRDQKRFGDLSGGMAVYELPLEFGNRSLFRTAVSRTSTISSNQLYCQVLSSSTQVNIADPKKVKALTAEQISAVLEIIKKHWMAITRKYDDSLAETVSALEKLEREVRALPKKEGDRAYTSRLARICDLVAMTNRLVHGNQYSLTSYDQTVLSAAQHYAELSIPIAYRK